MSEFPGDLLSCHLLLWVKASYVLSFVEGDVFIGIIRYQYVDRCFSFYLVYTINNVDVGVSSLC